MDLLDRPDLAWCAIDGELIFLDIAADRYFRLPQRENLLALASIERRAFSLSRQPAGLPLPADWSAPESTSPHLGSGDFGLGAVARALWMQKRVEARLAKRPLASVLFDLRSTVERHAGSPASSTGAVARTVRAFEQARLLRTAADRCLPRSIALALALAGRGVRVHTVLGVKLAPFAAHCWVQAGDEVLNDTLEEVLRYQPILVV